MKFEIKNNKIDGVVYDEEGFPILILDKASSNIDINYKDKNINLNLNVDNNEDIF